MFHFYFNVFDLCNCHYFYLNLKRDKKNSYLHFGSRIIFSFRSFVKKTVLIVIITKIFAIIIIIMSKEDHFQQQPQSLPVSKILATNQLQVVQFDYKITFDNFSIRKCMSDTEKFIIPTIQDGPEFRIRFNPVHEVYNPNGNNFKKPAIYLAVINMGSSPQLYVYYRTSIIDSLGKKFKPKGNSKCTSEYVFNVFIVCRKCSNF